MNSITIADMFCNNKLVTVNNRKMYFVRDSNGGITTFIDPSYEQERIDFEKSVQLIKEFMNEMNTSLNIMKKKGSYPESQFCFDINHSMIGNKFLLL